MTRFCIVLFLVVLTAASLPAQQPFGFTRSVSLPTPIPSRERSFRIPFEVRPDNSADPPKEIELMVSTDRGVRWHTGGRESIEAKQFDYKAENDGEYWFAFRTISLSGMTKQAGNGGPQIRVVVDATPPELSLDMKQQPSGEVLVQWKAGDRNLQGKRPDFSVASPEGDPKEPNWKPLNVDGRHFKVTETELEGTFLFWPENGVTDLRLRAVVTDTVGNRAEKICTATINPVRRSDEERIQDALKAGVEKPMTPDERVTAIPQNTVVPPPNPVSVASMTPQSVRIEPPKPVRMSKRIAEPATPAETAVEKPTAKTKTKTEPPKPTAKETVEKTPGTDPLTEKLLANMNRFFDGGLDVEIVEKTAEKRVETPAASKKPVLPALPPSPVAPAAKATAAEKKTGKVSPVAATPPVSEAAPVPGPPSPPLPASIVGVSLNTASQQAQIIVKWHPGDDPWHDAQADILRSTDVRGPWFPLATNLPNNGEYWWYLSSDDLRPFFVMIQLRSRRGGTHMDMTKSAIRVPPQAIGR